MTIVYRNNDERLGETCLFTMADMIKCYRANKWDQCPNGSEMTDDDIIEDVLGHDVEEIGEMTDEEIDQMIDDSNP